MIGSGLVRFHPHVERKQDGHGLANTLWKTIKSKGPTILKDVITASALAGVKGLKEGTEGGKVNWKGGVAAATKGAKRTLKRKATQELNKAIKKKVRKDFFGL